MDDRKKVEQAVNHIAARSKSLKTLFTITLVVYLVFNCGVIVLSVVGCVQNQLNLVDCLASIAPFVLSICIGAVIITIMRKAFLDVSLRNSPFTKQQSKRLLLTGILLLVQVVVEAIVSIVDASVASQFVASSGELVASGSINVHFNASYLIASIACFCLSYLFKYGSLLQWLYDETI